MAAFSGTAGSVSAYAGNSLLAKVMEWSLDFSQSPVETTEFSDSNDEYTPSIRNATGSFTGVFEDSLTGNNSAYLSNFLDGDVIAMRLYENATNYWSLGSVLITGMSPSLSVKGKSEIAYNFQVKGAVTYV